MLKHKKNNLLSFVLNKGNWWNSKYLNRTKKWVVQLQKAVYPDDQIFHQRRNTVIW